MHCSLLVILLRCTSKLCTGFGLSMTIMAHKKQHPKKDATTWKVPQEVAKDESSLQSVAHDNHHLTISKPH